MILGIIVALLFWITLLVFLSTRKSTYFEIFGEQITFGDVMTGMAEHKIRMAEMRQRILENLKGSSELYELLQRRTKPSKALQDFPPLPEKM